MEYINTDITECSQTYLYQNNHYKMRTTRKLLYIDMKKYYFCCWIDFIPTLCRIYYAQMNDNPFPYRPTYKCDTFVQHLDKVCYFMYI